MTRLLKIVISILAIVLPCAGQALPSGYASSTRWFIDTKIGTETELGYKFPYTAVGLSLETPLTKRIEIQGKALYSPDRKNVTNDGTSLTIDSMGLFWITDRIAVTGNLTDTFMWDKDGAMYSLNPALGFAVRERAFMLPGRFYAKYVFPTGCLGGVNCPIPSEHRFGPAFYWESRLVSHIRAGLELSIQHVLNQGIESQPNMVGTGKWVEEAHVVIRFEIPKGDLGREY